MSIQSASSTSRRGALFTTGRPFLPVRPAGSFRRSLHHPRPNDAREPRLHRHLHRAHAEREQGHLRRAIRSGDGTAGHSDARRRAGEPVVRRRLARSALSLRRLRGRDPTSTGKKTGFVAAYSIGADGKLTLLNRVPSNGADPCHISVSRSGRTVAVANYTGGSTASFKRQRRRIARRRHDRPARRPRPEQGTTGSGARALRQLRRRRPPAALVRPRRRRRVPVPRR